MRAYRQNDPTIQAFKTVRINVNRNPSPPVFGLPSYTFTVPENQALGSVIGKVNATDSDFVSTVNPSFKVTELLYFISRIVAYYNYLLLIVC